MKKKIILLILTFNCFFIYSQKEYTFGIPTNEELTLKIYKLDSTANAVVLFESANTTFTVGIYNVIVSTSFYKKIKIFNKEGFKYATFSIPLYNDKNDKEHVKDIKAITHNNFNKTFLTKSQIFEERVNDRWREVKFTMPNLKDGSVIEVMYTINTPFKFNLTGWEFQSDIPKKYSQFTALIPMNYVYNRSLTGYLKLSINDARIVKKCFSVPGYGSSSDCEKLTYAMENIPVFEEEEYMTTKENFISKIKFELSKTLWFDGTKKKYTSTWKAVDREFKTDKNIGGQFKKASFFKNKIPKEISLLNSDLEKAKAIYVFIQKHYSWNQKYSIFKNVNIKKAYENKVGNIGEINISLINALKFAGIKTELVLLSTRNNGFPTKLHPVISDFNYIIAKVNVGDSYYFLDATNKLLPFGMLPFKCLNHFGRVMDFKNESYWIDIVPSKNSKTKLYVSLTLNEDGTIIGKLRKVKFWYDALNRRKSIENKSEDDIISDFEDNYDNLEVINYTIENKTTINKPLIETFEVLIENFDNSKTYFFNPYFGEKFSKNPFNQKDRLYPVDFGYTRTYSANVILNIPENYTIHTFPKSKSVKLPENGGSFIFLVKSTSDSFILSSNIKISKPTFFNFEYKPLKDFFNIIVNTQKIPLEIKKL